MQFSGAYAVGLVINLSSALASAFMTVSVRRASVNLRNADIFVPVLEMSLFKMIIASIVIFPFTFVFENVGWSALSSTSKDMKLIIFGGVFITLAFQTTNVGLNSYSMATTMGVVSQCKMFVPSRSNSKI